MTFDQFPYERPDMEALSRTFEALLADFERTPDAASASAALQKINAAKRAFDSAYNLAHIRHTLDTRDAFYEQENSFFDQTLPVMEGLSTRFYKALLASPHRGSLEKEHGAQFFVIAELLTKTFAPEILEDLQKENALASEYKVIKARASIGFDGKQLNLATIHPFEISPDRDVRRRAAAAKWAFFAENREKIEQIFDELVKTRHAIAQKLGYKNFVELAYARLMRSDYGAEQVEAFRNQIQKHIVPLAQKLYERQRSRLGLETLKHFDEEFKYPSGNPAPKGSAGWIVENGKKMYAELSRETGAFFDEMTSRGLMDLVNRDGKATGGYCTYVAGQRAPFIFSNFNGTSHDIDVLTHEAGHAFQVWSSRDFALAEYQWPTYEACEIHSMSMEFFTWPWMELFFEDDTEKYKFAHLGGAVQFLPYGAAVDEFQHRIYENPHWSPAERNACWLQIEKKYLPHRDADGLKSLEEGCFWQRQGHIFETPFYYIDYALAQICAFQFWRRDREDHDSAWADYVQLCRAGGSRSFLPLVELAGLRSPFEEGAVATVAEAIGRWLDGADDSSF